MLLGAAVSVEDAVTLGVRAAQTRVSPETTEEDLARQRDAFRAAGVANVQFNAYCNLTSVDEAVRRANIERVRRAMRQAAVAGAQHVVVGGGHRDPACPTETASAHRDNWTPAAIATLADSCRQVLRDAPPGVTLVIETWVMTPVDSAASALALVEQVGHPQFGILFDVVNCMNLDRYWDNGRFAADFVARVGPFIKLVHLKDTRLKARPITFHMAEVPVGTGHLDWPAVIAAVAPLGVPVLVEHQDSIAAYRQALAFVRETAATVGVPIE
jgi:sugar phosphate isomerase/epimerase